MSRARPLLLITLLLQNDWGVCTSPAQNRLHHQWMKGWQKVAMHMREWVRKWGVARGHVART
jgi:hypothetical protein